MHVQVIRSFFADTAQKTSETAGLVTFTEEILSRKLHFLCCVALHASGIVLVMEL